MPARHSRHPHLAVPAMPLSAVPAAEAELVAALAAAAEEVPTVAQRLAPRFVRSEARRHAQAYLWGLLSPVERKKGWQLAEAVGDRTPHAVLVLDETAVVKKGTAAAGVDKQYAGVVGKLENAQVGVFLACASPQGGAFLDRALYLPEAWTNDRARCQAAGIPDDVAFATKPELARQLLERARAARLPAAWGSAAPGQRAARRLRHGVEG